MAMEGVEVSAGAHIEDGDVGAAVMSRFRNSTAPEHKQLRAVVGAMTEVLKDQGLPLSPTAYFAATMSPLEQQCSTGAVGGADTTAFCTFLAMVLPKVPNSVLISRSEKALEVLVKLLSDGKILAGTVKAGLSCLECVLRAADKSNWLVLAPCLNVLMKFTVDVRPKVRKRAQLCVAEVLSSFQGSLAFDKASEVIVAHLEQYISVFGKSGAKKKAKSKDATSNALEVLYMLGALRHVLPTMSSKGISKLLPNMALLLQLKQALVTRHVLNVLFALTARSRTDLPATETGKILEVVSTLISAENKDVDEVMTAVRVLQHGLANLYAIDRSVCATKLPGAFSVITELFASEQEEVVFGAAECLRSLVQTCIDDTMIRQGLEAYGHQNGTQPVIEHICASAEIALSYQYSAAWHKALHMVSALFERLGHASYTLMARTVKTLAELQSLSDEDMPCRKQLHGTLGAAIAAMGPDQFLKILPLEMDASDLAHARVWLLPILRQHIVGARLRYFVENILPQATRLTKRAQKYDTDGMPVTAKNAEACAQSLWALLPSFCNYPMDTKESFQLIAKPLGDAMKSNAKLRGLISSSLQILIKQNRIAKGDLSESIDVGSTAAEKAKSSYTKDVASANLAAIGAFSDKLLPLLFNIFCASPPEKRGDLQAAIGAVAPISSKITVQKFFKTVIEKLLEATKEADGKDRRCMFMDLALSLVGGLDDKGLSALFAVSKPALQDSDPGVQKKGYKVLACICKEHPGFLVIKAHEIFEILQAGTLSCQSSAKQYRIVCLQTIILHLVKVGDNNSNDCMRLLLKEAILALKEVNKKTRDAAYDLLIGIGHGLLDADEIEGPPKNLIHFFTMVVGCSAVTGSAGEPHAISAAISAISRLVYEFPSQLEEEVQKYLPSAFYLLRNYKSREVIKSLLGLMKVVVARLPIKELTLLLKDMVQAMMVWSDDPKNRFRAKVRAILEKLIRRCGFDAVSAVMPQEHAKHLTNIRKRKEQAEKKKRSILEGGDDQKSLHSHATTARRSNWNHTDFFSDMDDEDDEDDNDSEGTHMKTTLKSKSTVRSKKMPKSKKRLPEDMTENGKTEPLDLLDVPKTRAALSAVRAKRRDAGSDDEMQFDSDGRLIVEERPYRKRQRGDDEEENDLDSRGTKKRVGSIKAGTDKKLRNKKSKTSGSWAYKGDEYTNKKGAGDIKKDGKLEPYAYWPLDPKILNRRGGKKASARKGMESVFKMTKKMEGLSVNKALASKTSIQKKKHKAHKGGSRSAKSGRR